MARLGLRAPRALVAQDPRRSPPAPPASREAVSEKLGHRRQGWQRDVRADRRAASWPRARDPLGGEVRAVRHNLRDAVRERLRGGGTRGDERGVGGAEERRARLAVAGVRRRHRPREPATSRVRGAPCVGGAEHQELDAQHPRSRAAPAPVFFFGSARAIATASKAPRRLPETAAGVCRVPGRGSPATRRGRSSRSPPSPRRRGAPPEPRETPRRLPGRPPPRGGPRTRRAGPRAAAALRLEREQARHRVDAGDAQRAQVPLAPAPRPPRRRHDVYLVVPSFVTAFAESSGKPLASIVSSTSGCTRVHRRGRLREPPAQRRERCRHLGDAHHGTSSIGNSDARSPAEHRRAAHALDGGVTGSFLASASITERAQRARRSRPRRVRPRTPTPRAVDSKNSSSETGAETESRRLAAGRAERRPEARRHAGSGFSFHAVQDFASVISTTSTVTPLRRVPERAPDDQAVRREGGLDGPVRRPVLVRGHEDALPPLREPRTAAGRRWRTTRRNPRTCRTARPRRRRRRSRSSRAPRLRRPGAPSAGAGA